MSLENIKATVEALLFASEQTLVLEKIKLVLGGSFSTEEIRKIIEELSVEYESANRGIRIIEIAGGFQMITTPPLAPFIKKLFKERRVERLSKPALETLAMVAYKQPVTKLEIESLRNVNVDGVINSLLDKGLIRIAGRKKAPGRPYVFGTTKQFLEYFGLKSLEDLPKMEDFSKMVSNIKEGIDDTKEPASTNR